MNPNTTVVHRPVMGEMPATKENPTASGIIAKATTAPLNMLVVLSGSVRMRDFALAFKFSIAVTLANSVGWGLAA